MEPSPITTQPGHYAAFQEDGQASPRLESLALVDNLIIKQKVEMLEAICGCETVNHYMVFDPSGKEVFSAVEDTSCCNRCCCGKNRSFQMIITDNQEEEVMHLVRPLKLCCQVQELEVQSPPGTVIGYVKQVWSFCYPKFLIQNELGETVLKVDGPVCGHGFCNWCGDVDFVVNFPEAGEKVGSISKHWSGLSKEIFTDADNFGISFPATVGSL